MSNTMLLNKFHNFYINISVLYFTFLCLFYPYGITLFGGVSFRIPDLLAIIVVFLSLITIIAWNKLRLTPIVLYPMIPLISLEIILPILGGVILFNLSDINSGFRIILLYAPLILYFLIFGFSGINAFNYKFQKALKFILILNTFYCLIQIFVLFNLVPSSFLFTIKLKGFAVDEHFKVIDGLRASGFFINSTSLSIFGILSMSYFFAKFISYNKNSFLLYGFLSLLLIVLSTSRTAYVCALIIFAITILFSLRKSFKLVFITSLFSMFIIIFIETTVGVDSFFSRFIRLKEGLENDYSLGHRLQITWPYVLESLRGYNFGTLIPPNQVFGVIDSGYLTYYAQGKWLFIIAILNLFVSTSILILKSYLKNVIWSPTFLLFLLIYITLAMVVSNPLRSPILIYMLIYAVVLNNFERRIKS